MKVRLGHGANCSSIGAVVDTLFASAVVSTMIFAAVAAALTRESITIVGKNKPISTPPKADERHSVPESGPKSEEAET